MLRADGGRARVLAALGLVTAAWLALDARLASQGASDDEHLNPVVHRLAAGERVFGVSTYDLSLEHARSLARSDIDYVYVDMEHGPMDFGALRTFLLGMTDKRAIAESGSLRPRVAALVRIAPYGRESPAWAVKQALDIGLMGLIFPAIETPEQAGTRGPVDAVPAAPRVAVPGAGGTARFGCGDRHLVLGRVGRGSTCGAPTSGPSTRKAISWR